MDRRILNPVAYYIIGNKLKLQYMEGAYERPYYTA